MNEQLGMELLLCMDFVFAVFDHWIKKKKINGAKMTSSILKQDWSAQKVEKSSDFN